MRYESDRPESEGCNYVDFASATTNRTEVDLCQFRVKLKSQKRARSGGEIIRPCSGPGVCHSL